MIWEVKKCLSRFSLFMFALLLLFTVRMIWTQIFDGRQYAYEEERYYATGAEIREKNHKLGERYGGQIVDDDLFADFDVLVSEGLALDENGKARFDQWLYGTSLYTYSEFFDLGADHRIGEHYTDTESVFRIEPPRFAYTDGWNEINECLSLLNYTITFVCIIAAAFFFSSEYQNGMIIIIHTTALGREKTSVWKYFTAFMLSSSVYLLVTFLFSAVVLAVWGADGAGADIQLLSSGRYITVAEYVNCATLVFVRILCGWLGLCGAVAMSLAVSVYSPNPYVAVILSLAVYSSGYLAKPGRGISSILYLLPFHVTNAFAGDWSDTAPLPIWVIMYILATLVLCCFSLFLCRRRFSRWTIHAKR